MDRRYQRARAGFLLMLAVTPLATVTGQRTGACWLVRPAEAAQILATPDLASGDVMRDNSQDCDYLHAGFDVHMEHARTVAQVREALKQNIANGKVEAVSGVGDAAAFDKSDKQPSLMAVKGTHAVETTILLSRWHGSPDQIKPTLVKLAQTALAKLNAAATAQTSRACWLITPTEAAQILGNPQLKGGDLIHDDYDRCEYKPAGFDLDIIGYKRVAPRSDGFKTLVSKGFAEAVPGIGDEAILGRDADHHPTANVLIGSRELMITLLNEAQGPGAKAKLLQLAKTAAARLR